MNPATQYEIGDVVNGHRWNGTNWEPLASSEAHTSGFATYSGYLNGKVVVRDDLITLEPSGVGLSSHQFSVRSVASVGLREATLMKNGALSVTYMASGGSLVTTDPVLFRKGKSSEELLRAASWLGSVAAHNEAQGLVPAAQAILPTETKGVESTISTEVVPRDAKSLTRAERKAAKQDAKARALREAAYHDQVAQWQAQWNGVAQLLAIAESGGDREDIGSFILKPDEMAYGRLPGAALIEPRTLPGKWEGRSQGASFRVTKGVSYRVGANRGHYVPGPTQPVPIDVGDVLITNQRVVFAGSKQTREWLFKKLAGVSHDPSGWTALQVSNRQKTSGIAYGTDAADLVHAVLDLALADYGENLDSAVEELRGQLAELETVRPQPPTT